MKTRLSLTLLLGFVSIAVVAAVAPGPPQNLVAGVSGNTVTLTWLAPSTGGVPSSYIVEASLSPGGPLIASLPTTNTALVVTAVPNAIYYVAVRGVNADGASARSNEVIVVVPGGGGGCSTQPDAPTNLAGSISGNVVTLNWTPPVTGCPPTGYIVQAGSAPGLSDIAIINVGSAPTLSASAPPGTYYVRVIAVNSFGGSAPSNEIVGTVIAPPINLTGIWSGTSNYFNAPFTFDIVQNGNQISGRYSDQHDLGFVSGNVNGNHVLLDVYFGDTGIRYEGTIENANLIRGTLRGGVISTYTFEMRR